MAKDTSRNIGVLHPGAMGITVARSLQDSGHNVGWVSTNRSAQTQERAKGLIAFDSLDEISAWGWLRMPATARWRWRNGCTQRHLAVCTLMPMPWLPSTSLQIGEIMGLGAFVDGGIIGPPACNRAPLAFICPTMPLAWRSGSAPHCKPFPWPQRSSRE